MKINQEKIQLLKDRDKYLNLLVSIGCIINKEKSTLIQSQSVTYLVGVFT